MWSRSAPRGINITGMLMPWRVETGQPWFITIEEVPFIPIFSTVEKLRHCMDMANVYEYTIKQIDDGKEFLASVLPNVRVALNPTLTLEGNTRWTEIVKT